MAPYHLQGEIRLPFKDLRLLTMWPLPTFSAQLPRPLHPHTTITCQLAWAFPQTSHVVSGLHFIPLPGKSFLVFIGKHFPIANTQLKYFQFQTRCGGGDRQSQLLAGEL